MANPSFIGPLNSGRVLYMSEVRHKPELIQTTSRMASGAIRNQWGTRVYQHYECSLTQYGAADMSYLRSLRNMHQPVWFIDGIAYENNAMPYTWSCPSQSFVYGVLGYGRTGLASSGGSIVSNISMPDGAIVDSGIAFKSYTAISLTVPAFLNQDFNLSVYVKGSKDDTNLWCNSPGQTIYAKTATSLNKNWERLVLTGTARFPALSITITDCLAFAGLQITWGSSDLKPFIPGMATDRGIVGDISFSHENIYQGMLTPASFNIDEATL